MSENYIPLYRKYRPQTLETLVGQEHIKKTLTSAIELGKISHAYLFTGPRGTGKTSTARILAKSLNCKNGPTVQPCGECESCKDITNSIPIDVIEIDAASNRKVEDTQNLLEKIQYVPVNGKYKIYIIDEVHMLTNHAFNALLKTLEEPPENVIFILATTEVHKVLDTIKSRCQRFDFRRITTDDIVKQLRYISDNEKINITDDALFTIAKNAAGGMRDSISLLDQLSLLGITKEVTSDDVNAILGRISFDILYELSEKIISSTHSDAIEILNKIYNSGNEPLQILTNLNEYFKNLLIVKTCSKDLLTELTGLNEHQISKMLEQKDKLENHQIIFLLERTSYYIKELKLTSNQYLWLEVAIIDLANLTENTKLIDLQNRISALEGGIPAVVNNTPTVVTKPAPLPPNPQIHKIVVEAEKPTEAKPVAQAQPETDFTPPPMSKKLDGNDISVLWQNLLLNITSVPTKALLKLASPRQISPDNIIITFKNERLVSQINDSNKKQQIIDAANILFNQSNSKVTVELSTGNEPVIQPVKEVEPTPAPIKNDTVSENKPGLKNNDLQKVETNSKEEKSAGKNVEQANSDQEKMILDLFDGKYVE